MLLSKYPLKLGCILNLFQHEADSGQAYRVKLGSNNGKNPRVILATTESEKRFLTDEPFA